MAQATAKLAELKSLSLYLSLSLSLSLFLSLSLSPMVKGTLAPHALHRRASVSGHE